MVYGFQLNIKIHILIKVDEDPHRRKVMMQRLQTIIDRNVIAVLFDYFDTSLISIVFQT